MNSSQAGSILLEILIALAITSVILASVAITLGQSTVLFARVENTRNSIADSLALKTAMQKIIYEIDAHRFSILPKVHSNGDIRFSDNSLNPVMHSIRTPLLGSDAITSFRLQTEYSIRVQTLSVISNQLNATGCLRFPVTAQPIPEKTFLGISVDQFLELQGKARKVHGKNCFQFSLRTNGSMIFTDTYSAELKNILYLIPIKELYTLYIDKDQQLRYLGHRGLLNIENQPIQEGIQNIRITFQEILPYHLHVLSLRFTLSSGKIDSLSIPNSLSRKPRENFLFQIPEFS